MNRFLNSLAMGLVLFLAFTLSGTDAVSGAAITVPASVEFNLNSSVLFQSAGMVFVAKQTLATGSDSVTFTGLNGDTDEAYVIVGKHITPSVVIDPVIQFNGDTNANNYGSTILRIFNAQTSTPSFVGGGGCVFLHGNSTQSNLTYKIVVHVKSGTYRAGFADGSCATQAGANERQCNGFTWKNNSSNVTSITLHASGGGLAFMANSEFVLYRLAQS
ncbi:MAG TPA: hypothetical protein VKW04_02465 [Planctomycetota bacterium]|nr:hypothetical protein [Planctomycetota bacterium]